MENNHAEKISDIFNRIIEIAAAKKLTLPQYSQKLGLSVSFFHKPREIGISKILKICKEFPDISLIWILYGKGEMSLQHKNTYDKTQIFERIKKIAEVKELNQAKFCQKLGVSAPFFSKPRELGVLKILIICELFPDVSLTWLLYGEGNMFSSKNNNGLEKFEDFQIVVELTNLLRDKEKQINTLLETIEALNQDKLELKEDKKYLRVLLDKYDKS